ncbi:MAG: MMPL family transporter [bacterium]
MKKFKGLQADDNYEIDDGYFLTKDKKHLFVFITPACSPTETEKNGQLVAGIDQAARSLEKENPGLKIEYFGSAAVAAGNATQLKKDIIVTLAIALTLIILLLAWYFRNIRIPLLGFLPALFGGGFSLAIIYLVKGQISGIALGIGSVILGLIIDYALYIINHFRLKWSVVVVLKDMSQSIVVCCITTAGAFLCLVFLNSSVLYDLGLFAALSVTGAALFSLVILPHFLSVKYICPSTIRKKNLIDKIAGIELEKNWIFIILLIVLGLTGLFFMKKVTFEKDLTSLNYLSPKLKEAEKNLDILGTGKAKNVYIVSCDRDFDKALRINETAGTALTRLSEEQKIISFAGLRNILLSDSLQRARISRWIAFWNKQRSDQLRNTLGKVSLASGFKPGAFNQFFGSLENKYSPLQHEQSLSLIPSVAGEWINRKSGISMITTIVKVKPEYIGEVYDAMKNIPGVVVFDRQNLTTRFVSEVRHDFSLLVSLSMIFVTMLLLISFGRLELGLTASIPMFFSWVLTLGFMGITGIRFNIFNIIISSFIFGLGVDYSILMMRGMLHEFKYGSSERNTYKSAILLSSLTTLFGVAALFFAGHPALRSIALISVVGIISVVLVSFSIEPLLVKWFLFDRVRKNKFPVTARIMIKTLITWGNILLISAIMTFTGGLIFAMLPVPLGRKKLIFHKIFSLLCKAYIFVTFPTNGRLLNPFGEDFTKPCVITSNHQSLIETPAFLRLYPKILILTSEWVFRSPVFGPIARLAGFINIEEGLESSLEKIRVKFAEGYSILVFPEGHRSRDHRIQRFHRGAFYIAENLKVDILPILVFGSGDFLCKGDFFGKPNGFTMQIMKRISWDDDSFGTTYSERTKKLRQYYISLYELAKQENGTAFYYRKQLRLNYVFKGPVLEWYVRIKMRLERNFDLCTQLMPRKGKILDIGCGYGYVSYLLAMTSDERQITGIDYDPEKIAVAKYCFSKNDKIEFISGDITEMRFGKMDGYLLLDVLHYFPLEEQVKLLTDCIDNLDDKGVIIIRDANTELEKRHKGAKLTEFFSTNIGFNKTRDSSGTLFFSPAEAIRSVAAGKGLSVEVIDNKKLTSNNIYIISGRLRSGNESWNKDDTLRGKR